MDNATYAFNWLVQNGYKPHQAAGVVGNLVQESKVNPSLGDENAGDNGTARGIAQWRGARLAGLYDFAKQGGLQAGDLSTQLAYLQHELQNSERSAGGALSAAPDVISATRAMIGYERPQGWTTFAPEMGHGWSNRLAAAQKLAGAAPTTVADVAAPQQASPLAGIDPALLRAAMAQPAASFADALPIETPVSAQRPVQNQASQAEAERRRRQALFTQPIATLYGAG